MEHDALYNSEMRRDVWTGSGQTTDQQRASYKLNRVTICSRATFFYIKQQNFTQR